MTGGLEPAVMSTCCEPCQRHSVSTQCLYREAIEREARRKDDLESKRLAREAAELEARREEEVRRLRELEIEAQKLKEQAEAEKARQEAEAERRNAEQAIAEREA